MFDSRLLKFYYKQQLLLGEIFDEILCTVIKNKKLRKGKNIVPVIQFIKNPFYLFVNSLTQIDVIKDYFIFFNLVDDSVLS